MNVCQNSVRIDSTVHHGKWSYQQFCSVSLSHLVSEAKTALEMSPTKFSSYHLVQLYSRLLNHLLNLSTNNKIKKIKPIII